MFEVPEAKRVRREDLRDSDQSDVDADYVVGDDAEIQARVNAQIAAALGFDDDDDEPPAPAEALRDHTSTPTQRTSSAQADGDGEAGEDQGYEFNLFSTTGSTRPAKVILENDDEDLGDGAFVRPRPLSFYMSKAPSAKAQEEYSYAAVTADTITRRSKQPPWGMAMPWKVITISATRKTKASDKSVKILTGNTEEVVKMKRPGKKKRILLRQRATAKARAVEVAAKKNAEKEESLKDKKKRLNRIKKLRKRAKEKEKKSATGGEADAVDTASDSDDE